MAKKTGRSDIRAAIQPDWYLPEWMKTLHVKQATLARECGWNNSTMHGIYHGRTEYYRQVVNLISSKLNIQPYELLMPPEKAMAFRQFVADAEKIVTLAHDADKKDNVWRDGTNG